MKFMTIREFLRGGYQRLVGPTMVVRHGIPMFTVMPHGAAPRADGAYVDSLLGVPPAGEGVDSNTGSENSHTGTGNGANRRGRL